VQDRRVPFAPHLPPPRLQPFVAAAYGYRAPANPTGLHRGLPSRHLTLVLELRAPLRVAGATSAVTAHGVVGGLHVRPVMIDASVAQEGMQYALTPPAARALFGVPAGELRGLTLDLADLLGPAAVDLVADLRDTAGWRERFALVDDVLLRRVATVPPREVPDEVAEAWRLTLARRGSLRVSEVAEHVGWSRRHLSERFRLATGVTPKEAARIARFETTRDLLLSARRPALADLAGTCGYADQQHLAREWRSFTGCSISTWMREELPFVHDSMPAELAR
jgi:AraC-like DNA-binding protein